MNFEKVLDDFEGDKELLVEAMDLFLESVRNQIGLLRHAISDNDAEIVRKEAHSIKGGAANLTADELSSVAEGANLGLGCGNPTAIGELKPGDVVLDLGSTFVAISWEAEQRVHIIVKFG